jgi:threonine aldolase
MPSFAARTLSYSTSSRTRVVSTDRFVGTKHLSNASSTYSVITGSTANGVALGAMMPPHSVVLTHWDAYVQTDECGGPAMFSGAAKPVGLEGKHGGNITWWCRIEG